MSVEAVAAAIEHSTARTAARLVLLALAEAANKHEQHEAWLAIDTLSARTGLNRRNVQRALRDLEAAGEIGRVGDGRGGRGRTTRYRILLVERAAEATPFDETERAAETTTKGGGNDLKGGATATRSVRTEKNRRARAHGASAAPRGQHHNNGTGDGRAAIAATAAPAPCIDCGHVTKLSQGRCDPCYEQWAQAADAEHETYEGTS